MTFAYTIERVANWGSVKVAIGTYTNTNAGTGGDIDTGLAVCEFIKLQPTGASVSTNANAVNETLPVTGNAVTIVTDSNEVGTWLAVGY